MLRTQHDEPIYDVDDITFLIAMADWERMCEAARLEPRAFNAAAARTMAERHEQATGHRLQLGCCRGKSIADVERTFPGAQGEQRPVDWARARADYQAHRSEEVRLSRERERGVE